MGRRQNHKLAGKQGLSLCALPRYRGRSAAPSVHIAASDCVSPNLLYLLLYCGEKQTLNYFLVRDWTNQRCSSVDSPNPQRLNGPRMGGCAADRPRHLGLPQYVISNILISIKNSILLFFFGPFCPLVDIDLYWL